MLAGASTSMPHRALSVLCVLAPSLARAEVRVPAIFGSHMVLQRELAVPIWGRAAPGEAVTVACAGVERSTRADASGAWRVELPPLAAGGPYTLSIRGANELAFDDVLVGEVWLGSGQSNMHMPVSSCSDFAATRAAAELPRMRMFREDSLPASEPQFDCVGRWVVCSPETVGEFSGTLFFFGSELARDLDAPIGLVDSSLGGTTIDRWIRADAQLSSVELCEHASEVDAEYRRFDIVGYLASYWPEYERWLETCRAAALAGRAPPEKPRNGGEYLMRVGSVGHLFNSKIAPIAPFALRGVVWYQGENDVMRASAYRASLELLVREWRACFGRDELWFAFVQLPNFAEGRSDADWPLVREAQRRATCVPRTGLVATIDLGESSDIHPRNKREVGARLARWAAHAVHGRASVASGPEFVGWAREADAAVLSFAHRDGGLVVRGDGLRGFELLDHAGAWHPADARVDSERVVVRSADVAEPRGVRYAWAADPPVTLFGSTGLPAVPFTSVELD
ncbi:MAG: hypothetical protein HZA52_00355 [Planctomycetes bacterium]|nr:hypothetical protein [Planctomycetota bacterium]